ncbi:MAG TPA: SDR family oxidoreductase, partial [Kiloniellaceae bacterium]|nr:SDR family oxidoreductase [Kiloniellaceae bacterium]
MKIVITGNMGYVGPLCVAHLRRRWPEAQLTGVDSGLFAHCLTEDALPERALDCQLFRDVRDVTPALLEGADAVIQLAAVSNDPMGSRFEAVTGEINHRAAVHVARQAAAAGVGHFAFASSCSMYGYAEAGARKEDDALNPLTAYARSKAAAERDLEALAADGDMVVTALRFATACGFSPRLRLDLVLNDFVASALAAGRIDVLSDGTPWRPLIHVADMARAFEWAIARPASTGGRFLAVNVGSDDWNYQVAELAEAVRAAIPGTQVAINRDAPPDKRSYRVDFSRFRALAPDHQPRIGLDEAIRDLQQGLAALGFQDAGFRDSDLMRLNVLQRAIDGGRLRPDLRWQAAAPPAEVREAT